MSPVLATWLARAVEFYLAVGLLFAVPFTLRGARRLDPVARHSTWGFHLLIVPGSAALWPLLAWRWWSCVAPPVERNAHRLAAPGAESAIAADSAPCAESAITADSASPGSSEAPR